LQSAGGSLFAYDRTAPLDLRLGASSSADGVVRQELSYAATPTLRLKALLVHPAGGPWPLVIWSPGYGGDRRQQLPDADAAARLGVASLLIDERFPAKSCDAGEDLRDFVVNVVSRRRAVDLAQTLPGVDARRLAAAGFSYGASLTAALSGVDHRLVAIVLKSGRGHFTGYASTFCRSLGSRGLAAYADKLGVVDAGHWVPAAGHAAFLVQNGTQDSLSPRADVLALYAAVRGAKELRWYPASHDLDAAATADRAKWLALHLRTRALAACSCSFRYPGG
jgi:predicted esterase